MLAQGVTYIINLYSSRREPQLEKKEGKAMESLKGVSKDVNYNLGSWLTGDLQSLIQSQFTFILDPILTNPTPLFSSL